MTLQTLLIVAAVCVLFDVLFSGRLGYRPWIIAGLMLSQPFIT